MIILIWPKSYRLTDTAAARLSSRVADSTKAVSTAIAK